MNVGFVRPCGLEVRPRDPSLLPELARHFERSGFRVEQLEEVIEVERPDAPNDEQAAREIHLHLSVWRAMRPDSIESVSGGLTVGTTESRARLGDRKAESASGGTHRESLAWATLRSLLSRL